MPTVGFEPAIPASERPHSHELDLAATGIGPGIFMALIAARLPRPLTRNWVDNPFYTWCGYKITGLNFRFPGNLATASGVWYWLVVSPPFTVTISRSCGKQFGSSLCLKWVVLLFSVGMLLSVNVQQRVNMKCCVKLGKSATETYYLLKTVCGDECLSRTQVFEWFKRFKEGREKIGDDQRPGRPSTSKTDANIEKSVHSTSKNTQTRDAPQAQTDPNNMICCHTTTLSMHTTVVK